MDLAHPPQHKHHFCFLYCCLLILLSACNSFSNIPSSSTATSTEIKRSTTSTHVPTKQSDCPATGTARAARLLAFVAGHHQNLVYSVNEYRKSQGGVDQPTFGTLKRYDVATGQKTEIIKMPGVEILDAQVSADGQWLLFVAVAGEQARLQLIRMDGKELQTLYCAQPATSNVEASFSIGDIQWSFDQQRVVFLSQVNNTEILYLLNMQDGSLQAELSDTHLPSVLTWLDNTRLYLVDPGVDAPPTHLYLLDTSHEGLQSVAQLPVVFQAGAGEFCWDATSSTDGAHLFLSQCTTDVIKGSSPSTNPSHGPSTITVRPATGGRPQSIFTSQSLGIVAVRVIDRNSLLLLVKSREQHVDNNQNGLWKVNIDGTSLISLSHDSTDLVSSLNANSQYAWSNASRDGNLYSLQSEVYTGSGTARYSLLIGSLQGGAPTIFASIADGTRLDPVGWTTF